MTPRAPLLLLVALSSGAAFALLSRAVVRRRTAALDLQVHAQTAVDEGHPVREVAEAAAPIGKWWWYVPAAVLTGGYVVVAAERRSRFYGAASIVAAAVGAAALNEVLDELPQPPAPPGRPSRTHPVFPSGHAFGTCSVALTAAYVLTREELAAAAVAFPLALLVPLASSLGRMLEEKHWISDIVGGHLAAVTLSAASAAAYELARDRAE